MVGVKGNISKNYVFVLIDLGSSQGYISPKIVEACMLQKNKHKKNWLVQLAIGTKGKIIELT